jgi:hypothetical protein
MDRPCVICAYLEEFESKTGGHPVPHLASGCPLRGEIEKLKANKTIPDEVKACIEFERARIDTAQAVPAAQAEDGGAAATPMDGAVEGALEAQTLQTLAKQPKTGGISGDEGTSAVGPPPPAAARAAPKKGGGAGGGGSAGGGAGGGGSGVSGSLGGGSDLSRIPPSVDGGGNATLSRFRLIGLVATVAVAGGVAATVAPRTSNVRPISLLFSIWQRLVASGAAVAVAAHLWNNSRNHGAADLESEDAEEENTGDEAMHFTAATLAPSSPPRGVVGEVRQVGLSCLC